MTRIFKYPIVVTDEFTMALPEGAEVLSVQVQNGSPYIWALVNDEAPAQLRFFRVVGTGHPMPIESEPPRFIGTFQLLDGAFVGHLFEQFKGRNWS